MSLIALPALRPQTAPAIIPPTRGPSLADLGRRIEAAIEADQNAEAAADRAVLDFKDRAVTLGNMLIDATRHPEMKHGDFYPWLKVRGINKRTAQEKMRFARDMADPANARRVAHLPYRLALRELRGGAGKKRSNEWYSPSDIVERAKKFMGQIDLDPCWHPDCAVRPGRYYTATDDGLTKEWRGRVWLNPPFDAAETWLEKLNAEYDSKRVSAAVILIMASVGTPWFADLCERCAICFPRFRIRYNADASSNPKFGSVIAFLGPPDELEKFKRAFGHFGPIK